MGNQTIRQQGRNRYKIMQPRQYRQNYSIQVNSKNQANNSFLYQLKPPSSSRNRKKSFNGSLHITQNDQSILKLLNDSKDSRVSKKPQNGREYFTLDYSNNVNEIDKNAGPSPQRNKKQNDRILQTLSRKNQDLRKQLKKINDQLTEKLKKKKLVLKKKKNQGWDQEDPQNKKQNDSKTAGLRRELQNGYKQIDMYKRTLQQLKSKEQTEVSGIKIKQMENQVSQLDRLINQTMKKIDGMKNIRKHQEKNLQTDINQQLIDNVEILKRQQDEAKQKIKELGKRDVQRQHKYKQQQAYLFQVQKKYREMSGQYFPQLKKKSTLTPNNQSQSAKKPSTFDKYSTPNSNYKSNKQQSQYPSVFQVKTAMDQLAQLRSKHQDYHKKIDNQLQVKNKTFQQISKLQDEVKIKDKIIQGLKMKLVEIRKIIRPEKKIFGGNSYEASDDVSDYGVSQAQKEIQQQHQQDQFDIKHLIANIPKPIRLKPVEMDNNHSIKSGQSGKIVPSQKNMVVTGQKSQPKVWGSATSRKQQKGKSFKTELSFDDSVQFQSSQVQPLIIGVNAWVNKNSQILAIQAIYLNKDEIRYGMKSSNSADGFIVRYDLQAPDYLKNITGGFSQSGFLEYIAFFSKKGKSGVFGNKKQNQQIFTFGLASNQRPFRFNGATIMVDSQPRLCRIGIQICSQ